MNSKPIIYLTSLAIAWCAVPPLQSENLRIPAWTLPDPGGWPAFIDRNKAEIKKGNLANWGIADGVITMESKNDSTLLGWPIVDRDALREYPIISFDLWVDYIPFNADERKKRGDDSAFQLYLVFDKGGGMLKPGDSLNYMWTFALPKGETSPSPYFQNVKYISIEKGCGECEKWIRFELDYREDYKKLFNSDSVPRLIALALQADTNDTKTSSKARIRNLEFGKKISE